MTVTAHDNEVYFSKILYLLVIHVTTKKHNTYHIVALWSICLSVYGSYVILPCFCG